MLGATQDSFVAARRVLEKLTMVTVCPNTVRASTEQVGHILAAHAEQVRTTAHATLTPPPVQHPAAPRMYVTMDGVMLHIRQEGWKEAKLGTVSTTTTRPPCGRMAAAAPTVRTTAVSHVATLAEVATFGEYLWVEARRRGVFSAAAVVVLGDGSHWIWNLADQYFPEAVQIVDWYHASTYIWKAAHALFPEGSPLATNWAKHHLDWLWDGQVGAVIASLQTYGTSGAAITSTITYLTEHQGRMHYAEYRARGMQIGSGTIESGCKHVLGARLKQAGMIGDRDGAGAVATVRTWLKRDRWDEAMQLRPQRQRTYHRVARPAEGAVALVNSGATISDVCLVERAPAPGTPEPCSVSTPVVVPVVVPEMAPDLLADGAILSVSPRAAHPWKKAWSPRRQRHEWEQHAQRRQQASAA